MSGDCFITIEGVEGETQDLEFSGAIDVLSWDWGVNWSTNRALAAGGRSRGSADVKVFTFNHLTDNASAALLQRCCQGTRIPKAVLAMRRAGGAKAQPYLKITFTNAQITAVSLVHDAQNKIPLERISVAFEKVNFEYEMQSKTGATKSHKSFEWNLEEK